MEEATSIIVRRMLTEPKAALTSATLETSFARFMVSMAAPNEERAQSRRFSRWGLVYMAGFEEVKRKRRGG